MNQSILSAIKKLSNEEITNIVDIVIWEYHQNIVHSKEDKDLWQKMNQIRINHFSIILLI